MSKDDSKNKEVKAPTVKEWFDSILADVAKLRASDQGLKVQVQDGVHMISVEILAAPVVAVSGGGGGGFGKPKPKTAPPEFEKVMVGVKWIASQQFPGTSYVKSDEYPDVADELKKSGNDVTLADGSRVAFGKNPAYINFYPPKK